MAALVSFLSPQDQTGNSHSTRNLTSSFFTKHFWSTLPPRKGYTKPTPAETLLHVSSEGHIAKQAPAATARGIHATCSHPMSFLGISQPQAGWSFLSGAACSQTPSFPRFSSSSSTNKQEHAAFPQLQKGEAQEQAVATRTVEAAHTLLPRAAKSRYSEQGLPRQHHPTPPTPHPPALLD